MSEFYLYINNKLIKVVDDTDPLPIYNNMALFTRGSSRCMFENIYALSENYSQNTVFTVGETLASALSEGKINAKLLQWLCDHFYIENLKRFSIWQ